MAEMSDQQRRLSQALVRDVMEQTDADGNLDHGLAGWLFESLTAAQRGALVDFLRRRRDARLARLRDAASAAMEEQL